MWACVSTTTARCTEFIVTTCFHSKAARAARLLLKRTACCLSVRRHSWCDNTGAESAANKMFTTAWHLQLSLRDLHCFQALLVCTFGCPIAGPKNKDADYLSRWLENTPLAARWQHIADDFSLRQLWHAGPQISISPPSWKPDFPLPSGCAAL